jgi:hypothetical protein
VRFAEDDHMADALVPDRSNQAFRRRPRRTWRDGLVTDEGEMMFSRLVRPVESGTCLHSDEAMQERHPA